MPRYEVRIRQLEDLPGREMSFLAESPASGLQLSSIMQQAILAWNQRQEAPSRPTPEDYERLFELFNKGYVSLNDIYELLNIDPDFIHNHDCGNIPSRYNREPVI